MRLTKKKAIQITIELFEYLAETGGDGVDKENWVTEHYGELWNDCALCEYDIRRKGNDACDFCPYYKMFEHCCGDGAPFDKWLFTDTPEDRKKYAREFLEQVRQL